MVARLVEVAMKVSSFLQVESATKQEGKKKH